MSNADRPRRDPPSASSDEFVQNDPLQARALRRWCIAAAAVAIAVWLAFRYWQAHSNPYDVLHRLYALSYLIGLGLLGVAWHAWRYARRIAAAGQYPPPGGWVLGRTRVLRGPAAISRARQVIATAVALVLVALYALYLPHSITAMFPAAAPIQVDLSPPSPPADSPRHPPASAAASGTVSAPQSPVASAKTAPAAATAGNGHH